MGRPGSTGLRTPLHYNMGLVCSTIGILPVANHGTGSRGWLRKISERFSIFKGGTSLRIRRGRFRSSGRLRISARWEAVKDFQGRGRWHGSVGNLGRQYGFPGGIYCRAQPGPDRLQPVAIFQRPRLAPQRAQLLQPLFHSSSSDHGKAQEAQQEQPQQQH